MGNLRKRNLLPAFTLLELILVMIIITTVLAIAAPSLRGFFSSRQLNHLADRIAVLTRYASMQAVSESTVYRLNFDISENRYWLSVSQQGGFRDLNARFGERFTIPEDVELRFDNVIQEGNIYYIEFNPEGYGSRCIIQLKDKANIILLIRRSPTENFETMTLNEEYL